MSLKKCKFTQLIFSSNYKALRHLTNSKHQMFVKTLKFDRNIEDASWNDKVLKQTTACVRKLVLNQCFGSQIIDRIISLPLEEYSWSLAGSLK